MKTSIFVGMVAVLASVASMPVAAVEYHQNASGTCNGALPVFDQSLRFRPLAVANQASTTAYLSCTHMNLFANPTTIYGARINNTTATAGSIDCTFVSGRDSFVKVSKPKTQNFAAGSNGFILWNYTTDNANVKFEDLANLSCNLPAGWELEYLAQVVDTNL